MVIAAEEHQHSIEVLLPTFSLCRQRLHRLVDVLLIHLMIGECQATTVEWDTNHVCFGWTWKICYSSLAKHFSNASTSHEKHCAVLHVWSRSEVLQGWIRSSYCREAADISQDLANRQKWTPYVTSASTMWCRFRSHTQYWCINNLGRHGTRLTWLQWCIWPMTRRVVSDVSNTSNNAFWGSREDNGSPLMLSTCPNNFLPKTPFDSKKKHMVCVLYILNCTWRQRKRDAS